MEFLNYTDFRSRSKHYFEAVEGGSSFIIIRKGKPVAKISPFRESQTGWKRKVRRIKLQNTEKTTLDYLMEERSEK